MLLNSKAVNGLNPVRFESRVGFVPVEALELDDESALSLFRLFALNGVEITEISKIMGAF